MSDLNRNGKMVNILYSATKRGEAGLSSVPGLLDQIIDGDMWQSFVIEDTGEIVEHPTFKSFVETPPQEGLGTTVKTLINICHEHIELIDKIDGLCKADSVQGKRNDLNIVDNIHEVRKPDGTSKEAGLRRLRREIDKAKNNPDKQANIRSLQQQVFNHEISIHKALVTIGARRETMTIPVDPKGAAKALKRKFSPEQLAQLKGLLLS